MFYYYNMKLCVYRRVRNTVEITYGDSKVAFSDRLPSLEVHPIENGA